MRGGSGWVEGDAENNGGYGGGAPSFADLQATGRARPPAPAYKSTSLAAAQGASSTPTYGPRTVRDPVPPRPALGPRTVSDPASRPVYNPHIITTTAAGTAAPPTTPADPNAGESDFEKILRQRFESRLGGGTGAQAQTAAAFVPGANPFTSGSGGSPVDSSVQKNVLDFLSNPSGYSSDAATSTFNRLSGSIDDEFNINNKKIEEEMAQRGIPVSTITGGRYFDSNVARKSAKEDLAGQILTDQASTIGSDRARAIASGMGVSDQQFGQGEQELNDYLGYGQQSFNNQQTVANQNNAQQQQLIELLTQLFGGTGGGGA